MSRRALWAGDKTRLVLGCEVLENTGSALQGRQIALPSLYSRREPGGERCFPLEQEAKGKRLCSERFFRQYRSEE